MYAYENSEQLDGWFTNQLLQLLELGHIWRCIEQLYDEWYVAEIMYHMPCTCMQSNLSLHSIHR